MEFNPKHYTSRETSKTLKKQSLAGASSTPRYSNFKGLKEVLLGRLENVGGQITLEEAANILFDYKYLSDPWTGNPKAAKQKAYNWCREKIIPCTLIKGAVWLDSVLNKTRT